MDHLSATARQFKIKLDKLDSKIGTSEFSKAFDELNKLAGKLTSADRSSLARQAKTGSGGKGGLGQDTAGLGKDSGAGQSAAGESKGKDSGATKSAAGEWRGKGSR